MEDQAQQKKVLFGVRPDVAMFEEIQQINDNLKALVEKELPETTIPEFPAEITVNIPGVATLIGPKGDTGDQGETGKDGKNGLDGKNGRDGADAYIDMPALVSQASALTEERLKPFIPPIVALDDGDRIIEKINGSDEQIDRQRIKGIDDLEKSFSDKINLIPRGGGGGHSIQVNDGNTIVDKNVRFINFGTNLTASRSPDGVVTVNASGGSSSGFQTPTGTVDGSNKTFVFLTAPSAISVDTGRIIQKVSSDGTVNWTGTTTVILTIAPTFDIIGIA